MRHARWAAGPLVLLALLSGSTARAQEIALWRFNVSPYAGVFVFDDDELDELGVEVDIGPILGGRVGYSLAPSWQIEAAYGIAPLSTEISEFVVDETPEAELGDLTVHLFYGAINYLLAYEANPTKLLLTAGVGGLIQDPEGGDSDGDFLLELGIGFTHPARDWITIRGEARDHIAFCSAEGVGETSACPVDDDVLHHIEVSGAVQFWLF